MGILHDALSALRATADKAIEFADPSKAITEAEDKFKATVADTVHALEERVAKLEDSVLHPLMVTNTDGTVSHVAKAVEGGASEALSEIHDKFEELIARVRQVEAHPALAPAPAPPAAPPAPESPAADAPASA